MDSKFARASGRAAVNFLMAGKALLSPVALGAHAMIFNRAGKVLLARHSYLPGWNVVGGGVKRAEPPADALNRELREEIGPFRSDPPEFVSLYTRHTGWATNVIVLYRLMNAEVDFQPNAEISEIGFFDPASPPEGTMDGAARRLFEYVNGSPPSPYW